MAMHTFIYTGAIPAGNGADSPAYHGFDCPTGYTLVSAAGFLQNGNDQGVPFSPLLFTPSSDPANPADTPTQATTAIFAWVNPKDVDQSYQVTLICEEV
jgi:hypothetical protein